MNTKLLALLLALPAMFGCTQEGHSDADPLAHPGPAPRSAEPPARAEAPAPDAGPMRMAIDWDAPPDPVDPDALLLPHADPDEPMDHLARAAVLARHQPGAAIDELRQGLFDDPTDDDALRALAKLAQAQRRPVLAERALTVLAQVDADDPEPLERLARLQIQTGQFEAAIARCNQALTRDTGDAYAYHLRGRAQLCLHRDRDAIGSFLAATQLDPGFALAFNNLGYAYLLTGQNQKAEQALVSAATLDPERAMIQNNLGLAEQRLDNLEAARAAFTQATLLDPRSAAARVNLGHLANVASAERATDAVYVSPDLVPDVSATPPRTTAGLRAVNPALPPLR